MNWPKSTGFEPSLLSERGAKRGARTLLNTRCCHGRQPSFRARLSSSKILIGCELVFSLEHIPYSEDARATLRFSCTIKPINFSYLTIYCWPFWESPEVNAIFDFDMTRVAASKLPKTKCGVFSSSWDRSWLNVQIANPSSLLQ